jgi:hypothetical protein
MYTMLHAEDDWLLGFCAAQSASNWPTFQGDFSNTRAPLEILKCKRET